MVALFFRLLGKFVLTSSHQIFGALCIITSGLVIASWAFGSEAGLYSFALAFAISLVAFTVVAGNRFRHRVSGGQDEELHMLVFGVVIGTSIGILVCSGMLFSSVAEHAFPMMLFCTLFLPVMAMLLERAGFLESFDGYELFDE